MQNNILKKIILFFLVCFYLLFFGTSFHLFLHLSQIFNLLIAHIPYSSITLAFFKNKKLNWINIYWNLKLCIFWLWLWDQKKNFWKCNKKILNKLLINIKSWICVHYWCKVILHIHSIMCCHIINEYDKSCGFKNNTRGSLKKWKWQHTTH